jgi:hypothetical protein
MKSVGAMPNAITQLAGLSDQTNEGLRQLASSNHRSMQEQVRLLIDREVR